MTSALVLEQPGWWRGVTLAILLLIPTLPLAPLLQVALDAPGVGEPFWQSFAASVPVAASGAIVGFAIGLPLGIATALVQFRGRRLALAVIALPLLVPSVLWAIGWSVLAGHLPLVASFASGLRGCILVAATMTAALVAFAGYAATLELSRSQIEAALLAAGERTLLRYAARHALTPCVLAAALGAVLSLSDPGPGQILGVRTVATDILTTFAARYDLALAARQCLVLTLAVILVAVPFAAAAGPRLAHAVLARQAATRPSCHGPIASRLSQLGIAVFVLLAVVPPLVGLLLPLANARTGLGELLTSSGDTWERNHLMLILLDALATAGQTAFNTVLYAIGAGVLATLLATALAIAVGRSPRLRSIAMAASVLIIAWPPTAPALGMAHLATTGPAVADLVLRSRFTVCLVLALHFVPVATALALRAIGATSPSWTEVAALHGVSLGRYVRRILWPALRPTAALSTALVALLASGEIGTVLLLHPPGEGSLPLAIFTVMANAPEATVAALCLVYIAGALGVVAALLVLSERWAT